MRLTVRPGWPDTGHEGANEVTGADILTIARKGFGVSLRKSPAPANAGGINRRRQGTGRALRWGAPPCLLSGCRLWRACVTGAAGKALLFVGAVRPFCTIREGR